MSKHFLLYLPVIFMGAAALARPGAASAAEGGDSSYVSIETPAGGEPILVVRYPWTVHKNPSIEVRAYIPGEEESLRIRPLYFRHGFMKDKVTVTIYEAQAASAATRTTVEFLQRDIPFEAVGERNLFGRPAVRVICQTDVLKPNKEVFPDKARWVIYPFLEPWAADDETLFLSLPDATFSDPVRIRVFFLRDDDLVWSEAEPWPGLKKPEVQEAPEAKPAAAKQAQGT